MLGGNAKLQCKFTMPNYIAKLQFKILNRNVKLIYNIRMQNYSTKLQWKRINHKQSARWQNLSQLKA